MLQLLISEVSVNLLDKHSNTSGPPDISHITPIRVEFVEVTAVRRLLKDNGRYKPSARLNVRTLRQVIENLQV
jgi:hypothetical protein